MSHGSKKWIEAYDGKIIRSTDRTHKDYWRDLPRWSPETNVRYGRRRHKKFCPQCREAAKPVLAMIEENRKHERNLRQEWETKFGEAHRQWFKWESQRFFTNPDGSYKYHIPMPRMPRPLEYWAWVQKQPKGSPRWHFDSKSFLCPKHRTMEEQQDRMWWSPRPGNNPSRGWRKYQYRQYNASVKNKMRNEQYDLIPNKYIHGYLD